MDRNPRFLASQAFTSGVLGSLSYPSPDAVAPLRVDPVNLIQESEELLPAAFGLQCTSHRSGYDLRCGEKRRGFMAIVVMGPFFNAADPHWLQRCRAVQVSDLELLVHTQHDSVLRWIQIQPNDVGNFSHELRSSGKLEGSAAPWLHAVGAPGPDDRGVAQSEVLTQDPGGAVGNAVFLWRSFQCGGDNLDVINGPRPPFLGCVVKAIQSGVFEA